MRSSSARYMLSAALDAGATLRRAQLVRVDCAEGRVVGVGCAVRRVTLRVRTPWRPSRRSTSSTRPGRMRRACTACSMLRRRRRRLLRARAHRTSAPLALTNEVHAKVVFNDTSHAIPSESPMMIWADELRLEWDEEMRAMLADVAESEESPPAERARMRALLGTLPSGVHYRPLTSGGLPAPSLGLRSQRR